MNSSGIRKSRDWLRAIQDDNNGYIELNSKDCVRSRINSFGDKGDYIFRELSERDYGIDALIECFDGGVPTGKIAFLQIKGMDSVIVH